MISTKEIEKARARLHRAIDEEMEESTVIRLSEELDAFVVELMKTQKTVRSLASEPVDSEHSHL